MTSTAAVRLPGIMALHILQSLSYLRPTILHFGSLLHQEADGTSHGELQHGREGTKEDRREKERLAEERAKHIYLLPGSLLCPTIALIRAVTQYSIMCLTDDLANSGMGKPPTKGPGWQLQVKCICGSLVKSFGEVW